MSSSNVISYWQTFRLYGPQPNKLTAVVVGDHVVLFAPGVELQGYRTLESGVVVLNAPAITLDVPPFARPAPIVVSAPTLTGIGVDRTVGVPYLCAYAPDIANLATEQFPYGGQEAGLFITHAPTVGNEGGIFDQFTAVPYKWMVAYAPDLVFWPRVGPSPVVVAAPRSVAYLGFSADTSGYIQRSVANETWSTIRDAASGTFVTQSISTTPIGHVRADASITDEYDLLRRGGLKWDVTGTIATGVYIRAARLDFRVEGSPQNDWGDGELVVCSFSPTDLDSWVNADYSKFGEVGWGRVAIPGTATSYSLQITGRGLNELNPLASTTFGTGFRIGYDLDDTEPTPWAAGYDAGAAVSDPNDGTYAPTLWLAWGTDPIYFLPPAPVVVAAPLTPLVEGGLRSFTASYSGYIHRSVADELWTEIRDAASGTFVTQSITTTPIGQVSSDASVQDSYDLLRRGGLGWDLTDVVPVGAYIRKMELDFRVETRSDDWGDGEITICSFTPADMTSWANSDYSAFGEVAWWRGAVPASPGTDYSIEITGRGLNDINPVTSVDLGMGWRMGYDLDNVEPTPWSISQDAYFTITDPNDGSNPPVLRVQWSVDPIYFLPPAPVVIAAPVHQYVEGGTVTITATTNGYIQRSVGNEPWSTIRDTASGTSVSQSTTINPVAYISADTGVSNEFDLIRRGAIGWDLTDLVPVGAYITGLTIDLEVESSTDDWATDGAISVCSFTPADMSSWATSDYSAFGTVEWGRIAPIPAPFTNHTVQITGAGLNEINPLTSVDFGTGFRINWDLEDREPSWTAGHDIFAGITDMADTTDYPTLTVSWRTDPIYFLPPASMVCHAPTPWVYGGDRTLSPDSNGYIQRGVGNEPWSTIRGAASGTSVSQSPTIGAQAYVSSDSSVLGEYDLIRRGGLVFDTTGIVPTDGRIVSATLYFYGETWLDEWGGTDVAVCSFTPADPDSWVTGDYSAFGAEIGASRVNLGAGYVASQSISLTTAGANGLDVTGNKPSLGFRIGFEVDDNEPADNLGYDTYGAPADMNDSTNYPYLVVDWRPAQYITVDVATMVVGNPPVTTTGGA